ncbi:MULTISPECIES: putative oxidoreductase C-terminal domain-containing protein [unclassified Arcicella]|uniref:putative oxidoreductase C-terminal domain-containing protein n=1 Tax=unclassified Arcicella TaxID=2644986 RepID=UPI002859370D|nr:MULTISPECIES: putative oxidoreductase C-terminal domain-containing protein [unclassified Arcicella]MDR6561928.1 putative dehydrogenase [Arcicella sp. BE51]MDR6811799.1 putative dehydrogenase [Arcicella sp. BE140]MDR6822829.1 putative dehydrogenase [Arcicella sp. BE139]
MKVINKTLLCIGLGLCSSVYAQAQSAPAVKIITLDPGHFHAALVQKNMYPDVSPIVHVYAPVGNDVQFHIDRINSYNARADNPTHWQEKLYTGSDYLEKMLSEKAGNVIVIAGNNRIKADYLEKSVNAGFNVVADKPMIIDAKDFTRLKATFSNAAKKKVLLYDIMTERYEISTMLQRAFSGIPDVFGTLEKGTPDNPAVTKESVHHFYKYVSGSVLTRPAWFMDVAQQGEGMVDVTTHLVDLIQWECFPEQVIDCQKDIEITNAKRWTTDMTLSQFKTITKTDGFPAFLKKDLANDTTLKIYANAEINYQLKGVHAKASVIWAYKAPEGGGDTHYSIMRGTKANLIIRQGAEQGYKPTLYIEPINPADTYEPTLLKAVTALQKNFEGIAVKKNAKGWEVLIPEKYKEGHEAHFGRVTEKYLDFLKVGKLPAWEVPNMISKYYTTTKALEIAKKTQSNK